MKLGSKTIDIIKGDITESDCEAIVNAANNHFWMGGGVAGAIKRKGGIEIEREAMEQGPRPVGEAVLTRAGSLRSRFVIHAAVMGQDLQTDGDKIRAATRSSLALAELNGINSIAFPALGTGVGGFPFGEAARIMVHEAASLLKSSSTLARIAFVLFDQAGFDAFKKEVFELKS